MNRRGFACVGAMALMAALTAASVFAGEREPLWPEGRIPDFQPEQVGVMTEEAERPGYRPEEHRMPYLEWCEPPAESNRTGGCMILVSGGGYKRCCDGWLVEVWRRHFTEIGYQCVNLAYRTPRPKGLPIYQSAWEDGQRAIRLVRRAAAKRGFDPERIGLIGMSAGAHLATLLATSALTPAYARVDEVDDTPCHLNWAFTCAIAYALTDGLTNVNAREGDGIDVKLDKVFRFDAKTPPMCMFHGGSDPVSPFASTQVYRRLRQKKVPAELHLYADRPHCFFGKDGKGDKATGYDAWFGRAAEFLRQMNLDGRLGKEEPLMDRFAADGDVAHERREIWPEGRMPDVQTNQCTPYLEWWMPKKPTTRAIQIIYSGGGYGHSVPDGFEVAPARRYLNAKGMTVVTLCYRHPRPLGGLAKHTTAWQDLQRTIRIVRSEAAAHGLDPDRIGIMGSSAGGHLTLMGATSSRHRAYGPVDDLDKLPCNVQWGVAIYPAYALTDGADRGNTTGGNDDSARLVPEFSFDVDTCPLLFIHGDADGWAAMNSVKCWEQLRRMGIQGELHTLATRKHCFQRMAAPGTGSYTWLDRIWEFMNHKEYNK